MSATANGVSIGSDREERLDGGADARDGRWLRGRGGPRHRRTRSRPRSVRGPARRRLQRSRPDRTARRIAARPPLPGADHVAREARRRRPPARRGARACGRRSSCRSRCRRSGRLPHRVTPSDSPPVSSAAMTVLLQHHRNRQRADAARHRGQCAGDLRRRPGARRRRARCPSRRTAPASGCRAKAAGSRRRQ